MQIWRGKHFISYQDRREEKVVWHANDDATSEPIGKSSGFAWSNAIFTWLSSAPELDDSAVCGKNNHQAFIYQMRLNSLKLPQRQKRHFIKPININFWWKISLNSPRFSFSSNLFGAALWQRLKKTIWWISSLWWHKYAMKTN